MTVTCRARWESQDGHRGVRCVPWGLCAHPSPLLDPCLLQEAAAGDQLQTLNLGPEVGPSSWERVFLLCFCVPGSHEDGARQGDTKCVPLFPPLQPGPPDKNCSLFRQWAGLGGGASNHIRSCPSLLGGIWYPFSHFTSPLTRLGPAQLSDHRSKELEGREDGPGWRGQGRS